MILKISKPSMTSTNGECFHTTLAILYRKNKSQVAQFWNFLADLVRLYDIDFLVGDFNVNYFEASISDKVKEVLPSYSLVPVNQMDLLSCTGGTHIDGGMLDLMLMKNTCSVLIDNFQVKCLYFSDHDLVKAEFKFPT